MATYDLVIVGAGSAGLAAARFARELGVGVALVEAHRIGGDCTWTGCVPSKALLHAAQVAHHIRHADAVGLPAREVTADLAAVMAHVQAARARVYAQETPEKLHEEGIAVHLGPSRFRDPRTLEVDGQAIQGKHFLICTGASPAVPTLPGLADGPYLTNHTVFELQTLPERLVALGGGPIGVELAQAFARLGSAVTIVQRNARLLPPADPEASEQLLRALRAEGLTVLTGTAVERVERDDAAIRVVGAGKEGPVTVECDALLVALGRTPNVEGLGLEAAGVRVGRRGIEVDAQLRTSQPHIYAAGDVAGSFQFTHYAGWQAVIAVRNALLPGSSKGQRPCVPWAIFTDPEVAQVGLTEAEARQAGETVEIKRFPLARNDRAQTSGEQYGLMKFVLRPNGTIVGATVVGGAAGEIINELSVAIDNNLKLGDLARSIHAYPTYGFALQLAAADEFYTSLTAGVQGALIKGLTRFTR
jgi:pyruvate/2-oxoglutarate dehydrogenase complex dihydrolipoamide dehydrogenase (E3) component